MTVRKFLLTTGIPFSQIAREVKAHVTRVYQWRDGKSTPGGVQLARLVLVSGGEITLEEVAGKPVPKNLSILKSA